VLISADEHRFTASKYVFLLVVNPILVALGLFPWPPPALRISSITKVSVKRLSIMIIPWFAVSPFVLLPVTHLPSSVVLALSSPVH
jgi:Mg2+/citrate symporter